MSLDKLFESLDEKVFTPELKKSLEDQFNEAVEAKATEIMEAKLEAEVNSLNEKAEQHIDFLNQKAEEYIELKKSEMVESLDKYLDRVVEEFIAESKTTLDESLKSEKADMLIEAFEAMLIAGGVDIAKISEAKDNSAVETKLQESINKYDSLVEENISLKAENDKLLTLGIISEMKEGLSLIESEKFEKLAALVEFSNDEKFVEKLTTIKESIKGAAEQKENKITEAATDDKSTAPVWAHLV